MRTKSGQKGFTLVEVMIVVAIIGILAAIATPALLNSLPNMRLRGSARDIYSTMMQTKVEALRRGENVTLLFNNPVGTYRMFLDNGAGPGLGGIANNQIPDGTETILVAATPLPARVIISSVDLNNDGDFADDGDIAGDGVSFGGDAMIFTSRGIPVSAGGGLGMGGVGLIATDVNGNPMRKRSITVSTAGRVRVHQ